MKPDRFHHVAEIFRQARTLEDDVRADFLDDACGGDETLRAEVQSLLDVDDRAAETEARADAVDSTDVIGGERGPVDPYVGRIIGHYHVRRLIASGGMGRVYEARQEQPRRAVALKLMNPGVTSRDAHRRFKYEAQILARLRHPGIAQIYEAGFHDDGTGAVPFFAMEYIPNARAITEFAERNKLSIEERLTLFIEVCEAVHHGHQKGIIHRDLKPGNILVDSNGRPRIIDFGVARATDSDLAVTTLQTSVGQLIGTLQYMSPEQCAADPEALDTRSDVYALGVVLYELFCERRPHNLNEASFQQAMRIIETVDPDRPGTVNAALRGDVETIILKALQRDRTRRYESAAELGRDIRRFLDDEAITARPPTMTYQLRLFSRRHRAAVFAAGGIAAALVLTAVLSTMFAVRSQREAQLRREVEQEAREVASLAAARLMETLVPDVKDQFSGALPGEGELEALAEFRDEALDRHPEVGADVLVAIGQGYRERGHPARAARNFMEALTTRRSLYEPPHAALAECLHELGNALWDLARYEKAEASYREALEMRRQLFAPEGPEVAESLNGVAACRRLLGDLREADRMNREVLKMRRRLLSPKVGASMNNLAKCLQELGRFTEAEELFRQALDLAGSGLPPKFLARTQLSLAACRGGVGDLAGATALLEEALAGMNRTYPNNHPDIPKIEVELGWCRLAAGDLDGAEELARTAVTTQIKRLPDRHPDVAGTRQLLGAIADRRERPEEARRQFNLALEIRRSTFGDFHPEVAASWCALARLDLRAARPARARERAAMALGIQRDALAPNHPAIGRTMALLGKAHLADGDTDEGCRWLHLALEAMEESAQLDRKVVAEIERLVRQCP